MSVVSLEARSSSPSLPSLNGTTICPTAQPKTSESSLILLHPLPLAIHQQVLPARPSEQNLLHPPLSLCGAPQHLPPGQLVSLIPLLSPGYPLYTRSQMNPGRHESCALDLLRTFQGLPVGLLRVPSALTPSALLLTLQVLAVLPATLLRNLSFCLRYPSPRFQVNSSFSWCSAHHTTLPPYQRCCPSPAPCS